jgi:hypothetical protein
MADQPGTCHGPGNAVVVLGMMCGNKLQEIHFPSDLHVASRYEQTLYQTEMPFFVFFSCLCVMVGVGASKDDGETEKTDRSDLIAAIKPVAYQRPLITWNPKERAPRFYDASDVYPFLEDALLPHAAEILAEMKANRLKSLFGFSCRLVLTYVVVV